MHRHLCFVRAVRGPNEVIAALICIPILTACWKSLYDHQRIYLLNHPPPGEAPLAEKSVYKLDGAPIWLGPPTPEYRGVMERNDAARDYKWMPVIPISLDTFFRVVSIEKKKIDAVPPLANGIKAEFFDPDYSPVATSANQTLGRPLHGIDTRHPAEVKRVNQPERP